MRVLSTISEASPDISPQDMAYYLCEKSGQGSRPGKSGPCSGPYFCYLDSSLIPDKYSRYSYIAWEPAFVLRSHGYRNEFINTSLNIRYYSYCHPLLFLKENLNDFVFHLPGQKKNIRTLYIPEKNLQEEKKIHKIDSGGQWTGTGAKEKVRGEIKGKAEDDILPDFRGGFIGYFAYDLKDYIEKLPQSAVDDLRLPIIYLAYYNRLLAFDHERGRWLYIRNFMIVDNNGAGDPEHGSSAKKAGNIYDYAETDHTESDGSPGGESYDSPGGESYGSSRDTVFSEKDILGNGYNVEEVLRRAQGDLEEIFSFLDKKARGGNIKKYIVEKYLKKNISKVELRSNFSKKEYLKGVVRTKKYIYEGDIYQANFSQRFAADLQVEPMDLYYILREKNAAPFSAYLGFPGFAVGSSSPERFLYLSGDTIETRPIKGTRPRGRDMEEDLKLACELEHSIKDRAELNMIVDLERNDLGKFCYYGTVKVCEHAVIEKYARVFHSVSTVRGKVKEGTDMSDIIRATFPGGSITGAPKIRAMEIIDELEPVARNAYTGSIGYIGIDNTVDLNIVIRTFIIKGSKFYYNVGGGIVADSDPEEEFRETMDKGSALRDALKFFEARNLKKCR